MSETAALVDLIARARQAAVFTGAGISTESGIPDFRSPGGVWSRMSPIYFDDFVRSEEMRREAWRRVFSRSAGWTGRAPNAGHFAVARLIAAGKAGVVITQNVDNLHQDSGVPASQVIELHGNASYAKCLECGLRHELADFEAAFLERDQLPACRSCAGIVKTATISFGQPMPEAEMARARDAAIASDLFLVLGSSLVVWPAAGLPLTAKRHGAKLAIVNREPTDLDRYADLVINTEIGPLMSEVIAGLGGAVRAH
ncbi:MAG TPA: Sir2 family NAD-dependent protein deacetylase [Caulobacteraceae bacterium]|nr:Sir2 family NAD-dependent protein deacetylase [Caulobacteraceae bacterium]